MANRTGQSHAIPRLSRETGVSGAVPVVTYARSSSAAKNAGEAAYTLANTIKSISQKVEDRLDIAAEVEANRRGSIEGAKDKLPVLGDDTTIRGRAFNIAAKDAAAIRIDMQGRERLKEYEEKHRNNPAGFKRDAEAYIQGSIAEVKAFDPALGQRYEAEYKDRMGSVAERIRERHEAIVRDRQLEQSLRYQLTLQDEMSDDAAALFSGDAKNAQATLARMMGNAARIVDTANQVGPDGRPLFSARERIAAELEAEQLVAEKVGEAWISKQPDMLTAYELWNSGKAEIELQDEKGGTARLNLKDALGPRGYEAANKNFMEKLRSELYLRNQIDAQRDRDFKDNSDRVFTDLMTAAQGQPPAPGTAGPPRVLSLQMVEAAKSQLEPERYIALRALARKGGVVQSSGAVITRLSTADADGADVRQDLTTEYAAGNISTDDYVRLYSKNSERIEKGVGSPIELGRDVAVGGLSKLITAVGAKDAPQYAIAATRADADYSILVEEFIKKNEREPTAREARDLGLQVLDYYAPAAITDALKEKETPLFIQRELKQSGRMTPEDVRKASQETADYFMKLHGGDEQAVKDDPEYQEQMRLLREHEETLHLYSRTGQVK